MRLIDRSKLKMDVKKWLDQPCSPDDSIMVALDDIAVSVLMTIEEQPLVNAIPIPEEATNGDMIMTMFNCMVIEISKGKVYVEGIFFPFDEEWWNAPYKRESEGDND